LFVPPPPDSEVTTHTKDKKPNYGSSNIPSIVIVLTDATGILTVLQEFQCLSSVVSINYTCISTIKPHPCYAVVAVVIFEAISVATALN
tara:strand:+ start:194 stop:460 length:267 start_codon:yes stop_codon:yes gene_type:complete